MTHAARGELADAIRGRYSAVAGKDKRKILLEFIAATGYHEKSAIRILNSPVALKHRQTRQRTPLYDEAGSTNQPQSTVVVLRSWMNPVAKAPAFATRIVPGKTFADPRANPRILVLLPVLGHHRVLRIPSA